MEADKERVEKKAREDKEKMKQLNDQIGGLDDSLAASEYRCFGLEADLKTIEKELKELKGN